VPRVERIKFCPEPLSCRTERTVGYMGVALCHGVRVAEEAEAGSETGPHLMQLADRIASSELTNEAAIADARSFIRKTAAY
jgi:hypothetical protein